MADGKGGKKFGTFSKVGLLLGVVFGGLTAFQVWPDAFPSGDILAPMQVAGEQFQQPDGTAPAWVPWAVKGAATVFFGLVGFVLTQLKRLWWLLLVLAALWGAGYLMRAQKGDTPARALLPPGAGVERLA